MRGLSATKQNHLSFSFSLALCQFFEISFAIISRRFLWLKNPFKFEFLNYFSLKAISENCVCFLKIDYLPIFIMILYCYPSNFSLQDGSFPFIPVLIWLAFQLRFMWIAKIIDFHNQIERTEHCFHTWKIPFSSVFHLCFFFLNGFRFEQNMFLK